MYGKHTWCWVGNIISPTISFIFHICIFKFVHIHKLTLHDSNRIYNMYTTICLPQSIHWCWFVCRKSCFMHVWFDVWFVEIKPHSYLFFFFLTKKKLLSRIFSLPIFDMQSNIDKPTTREIGIDRKNGKHFLPGGLNSSSYIWYGRLHIAHHHIYTLWQRITSKGSPMESTAVCLLWFPYSTYCGSWFQLEIHWFSVQSTWFMAFTMKWPQINEFN